MLSLNYGRDGSLTKRGKRLGVAKETGYANQHVFGEPGQLSRIIAEEAIISGYLPDMIDAHAALDAAPDGGLFVAAKIAFGFIDEQLENGVDVIANGLRQWLRR